MKHDMLKCAIRIDDGHWICSLCGKDAGNKFPKPDYDNPRKDSVPQCDGVQITQSIPSFVHQFRLKEELHGLIYSPTIRENILKPPDAMQKSAFRFSSSLPVTWEQFCRYSEARPITIPKHVAELNFVLKTLRAEGEAKKKAANSKRKAGIALKK
jgi:hypothetical protein